jgi:hypothetical protein
MPAQFHNDIYDNGLNSIPANCNVLHILSADPGVVTYGNIATYSLGNKATPTIGAPENHTTGRKVTVSAVSDGVTTATGTASHFALVDSINSKILVTQELSSPLSVTTGHGFTLTTLYVAIPAPTS